LSVENDNRKMSLHARIVFSALILCGGCHINLHDPGTDPPPAQFYFPAGIAIDPSGRWLYVSNGNADLRFSGGTVQLIDLLQFECDLQRQSGRVLDPSCGDPATVGDHAAQSGCQNDPLDPSVIDCDETRFVEEQATVKVGNFAGSIRLLPLGENKSRLFVAVRGDPSITRINVDLTGSPNREGTLDCFDPSSDPANREGNPPGCDASALIQSFDCNDRLCAQTARQTNNQLPSEPFGMALDPANSRLLLSSLATGQVTLVDTNADPRQAILNVSGSFFAADAAGRHGAFALAQQQLGNSDSPWYLSSNLQPEIATFRVAPSDIVIPSTSFSLSGPLLSGSDARDLAFEPGGNRLFVTNNSPPTLLVVDTSSAPDGPSPGQPRNQVVEIIDSCQSPSHMGVRRVLLPGGPLSPPLERTRIYVICFASDQVMVVDPDRPGVEAIIQVGRGPDDVAFNFGDGLPPPLHRRAYVTLYTESTIGVIDLDPGSPTENRLIGRIGLPFDRRTP
jgi:hypothetical protein